MEYAGRHILLIEDSLSLSELYRRFFTRQGYEVSTAAGGQAALHVLSAHPGINLIILDLDAEPDHSLQTLQNMRKNYPACSVIAVTGHASVNRAVDAMKAGAADFLIKPFHTDKLVKTINDIFVTLPDPKIPDPVKAEAAIPSSARSRQSPYFGGFIGTSPVMQETYKRIEKAAKSEAGVFITGSSGTGKEICAEAVHKYSKRATGPFVALNCAAMPDNLIESELFGHVKGAFTGATDDRQGAAARAHGGTLFLDEICEMHPDTQAKLLRFLQDKSFQRVGGDTPEKTDARIICASNQDVLKAVETGAFREDLYYRLHVIPVTMPDLKDRGTDILDLTEFFIRRFAREEQKEFIRTTPDTDNILMQHDWPGNVRELENLIRQIIVLHDGPLLESGMLPDYLQAPQIETFSEASLSVLSMSHPASPDSQMNEASLTLEDVEKQAILRAIEQSDGNIPKAAEILGVSPSTIYRKKTAWEKAEQAS